MIKQETINETTFAKITLEKIEVEIYTCSDGKKFTNQEDWVKGRRSGKELAEEHEEMLSIIEKGKLELKFHSISDNSDYNAGYEEEFTFYLHPGLSEDAIYTLDELIFVEGRGYKHWNFLGKDPGIYIVKQKVKETAFNDDFECTSFYFDTLETYCQDLEKKAKFYRDLTKEESEYSPKLTKREFVEGHPVDFGVVSYIPECSQNDLVNVTAEDYIGTFNIHDIEIMHVPFIQDKDWNSKEDNHWDNY